MAHFRAYWMGSSCDTGRTADIDHIRWYGGFVRSLCVRWHHNGIAGREWCSGHNQFAKLPRFGAKLCGRLIFGDQLYRHDQWFYLDNGRFPFHARHRKWHLIQTQAVGV